MAQAAPESADALVLPRFPLERAARRALIALAVLGLLTTNVAALLNVLNEQGDPDTRAVVLMGWLLMVLWCILGGSLMYLFRGPLSRLARRIPLPWTVRFVLLAILFAMLEEAVTTSLTNAAPLLGARTSAARITISTNYFEVISNSVVAFIPWFIAWAWLQHRVRYSPTEVVLLFGLNGTLAESFSFGWTNLAAVGFWTYVYGLMVFIPALSVPRERPGAQVRWYHWLVGVFPPMLYVFPVVLGALWYLVRRLLGR